MALTKEQQELYKNTMKEAKEQLDKIDEEIEKEIQKAKEKLAKLQESKKSHWQVYEGAAKLLGIEVKPEEEKKEEKEEYDSKES